MMNSQRLQDLSAPSLDIDELSARCLGRLDLVAKVLGSFHSALGRELQQLEQAFNAADADCIGGIAHRLKGTALTVSAHRLKACTEVLETAAAEKDLPEVEQCVAAVKRECDLLGDLISTYSQPKNT
jgi:HPt (histidine-containing phosphotransfer) domain-containing protein